MFDEVDKEIIVLHAVSCERWLRIAEKHRQNGWRNSAKIGREIAEEYATQAMVCARRNRLWVAIRGGR